MALKVLSIIKDEFIRARANTPFARHALLEAIERTIIGRIEKECIEQEAPGLPEPECCLQQIEETPERCVLDPSHEGPCSPKSGGCTWCKEEPAAGDYWIRELGEFRDCQESLCESCRTRLTGDGIRVEAVVEGPQEHCRFCGEIRERCHGGGGPDGMKAHDFTPPTPEEIHELDDVPF